jgi:hypothetical protein
MIQSQKSDGFGRVELIDHRKVGTRVVDLSSGRAFQGYGRNIEVLISVQDGGNTLKIFLSEGPS